MGNTISQSAISELRAGDFDGLTNLSALDFDGQSLTTLPAGLFSAAQLSSLTTIDLSDNQLNTLPARTFASLPALTALDLSGNEFTAPPAGLFTGLAAPLATVDLRDQFRNDANTATIANLIAPMSLSLTAATTGNPLLLATATATLTVAAGLPSAVRVPLVVSGHKESSVDYVPMAFGQTSGTATLVQAAGETLTASIAAGAVVPPGTLGLLLFDTASGICNRTDAVETALLAAISGISDCANVTPSHLFGITSLDLSASTPPISSLSAGDFAGLRYLTTLDLSNNSLTALPHGIFDSLIAATSIDLGNNALTSDGVPQATFAATANLATLNLSQNSLTTLSSAMLSPLFSLATLNLSQNNLTALPPFLPPALANLTTLNLSDNQLTQAGVTPRNFAPLAALTTLDLSGNEFSFLTRSIFEGLTVPLTNLDLQGQFSNDADATNDIDNFDALLRLNFDSTTKVATVSIRTGAPETLTVPLTLTNAASNSPIAVTIPAGATSASATLVAASGTTLAAALGTAPTLTNTLLGLTLITSASGICGRTPQVQLAILASNKVDASETCATISASDLSKLTNILDLRVNSPTLTAASAPPITALQAGDFAGMTNVNKLRLSKQSLTELPAGLFNGMTLLQVVDLRENQLTADGLPPNLFANLLRLYEIRLQRNLIDTLPDNLFAGLNKIEAGVPNLKLIAGEQFRHAPGIPARNTKINVLLTQTGNLVTATIPSGAPVPTEVHLSVLGTADSSSPTKITINRGATTGTATLLPATSGDILGARLRAENPVVWTQNQGVIGVDVVAQVLGICNRTAGVQAALIATGAVTTTDCRAVTESMLAAISGTLDLSNRDISTLRSIDFDGLPAVTGINLSGNSFTALTANQFSGLDHITALDLSGNSIATTVAGTFSGLDSLTALDLSNSGITTTVAGTFTGLDSLTALDLSGNSITTLAADTFTGLDSLTTLDLSNSGITTLATGTFTGLDSVSNLDLSDNQLMQTGVASGIFGPLAAMTQLDLTGNEFTALPDGIFADLQNPLARLDVRGQFRNDDDTSNIDNLNVILTLALNPTTKVATATIPTGAPVALDLKLLLSGQAASSPTSVTIAAGATSGTATLVEASAGNLMAAFDPTPLTASTLPGIIRGLILNTTSGICTRSEAVQAALITAAGVQHCTELTPYLLASLTGTLDLSVAEGATPTITALSAGDFDGLPKITAITLQHQGLTSLPAGIFSDAQLRSLTTLNLSDNELATLPAGSFASLGALTTLDLSGNEFPGPPDSLFAGLSQALTTYDLRGQFRNDTDLTDVDNFYVSLTLNLDTTTNIATVTIPTGAPKQLMVNLDLTNAAASSPTAVTIAAGATTGTATLVEASGMTLAATLNPTAPTLPDTGLTLLTAPLGVCDRTLQVQTALVVRSSLSSCAAVTAAHLSAITSNLSFTATALAPAGLPPIRSLKSGDFDGLSGITGLDLTGNQLSDLPAGIFSDAQLTALNTLNLSDNQLTQAGVPARSFASLAALTTLDLSGNEFTAVPDDLFAGLSQALTTFDLRGQFRNDSGTPDIDIFAVPLTLDLNTTTNVATVTIPTGAPEALTVTLDLTHATAATATVTIAAGATTGDSAALTADSSGMTLAAALSSTPPTCPPTSRGWA